MNDVPAVNPGSTPKHYRSWLLRLWREHPTAPWRLQLTNVSSQEQLLFEDLATLFDFLAGQMEEGNQ